MRKRPRKHHSGADRPCVAGSSRFRFGLMKSYPIVVLAAGVLAVACAPDAAQPDAADLEESPAVGAVSGTASDGSTDTPLAGVQISAGEFGTRSDDTGEFGLASLRPGPLMVQAYKRGFVPESVTVIIEPGISDLIDFPMTPASPPCCDLMGIWSARVVLDSAGLNVTPAAREASGEIVFDGAHRDPGSARVRLSAGASRVDFASLLGPQVGSEDSARGSVFGGDSVAITVVPQFADWGVELLGRVSGDTVRGIWYQRASCCGAYGTFTLLRTAAAE